MAGCQKAVGADRARGKAYAIRFLRRLAENITLVGQSASVVVTKIGINFASSLPKRPGCHCSFLGSYSPRALAAS